MANESAGSSASKSRQGARSNRLPVSLSGQISLLTDFGTSDYYVGAVKGVILSTNPKAQLVDITHDIPPHDIEAGAFALLACYRSFQVGTIHVAIVDPGVGSSRRAIIALAGGHLFVGPDNGIFSYVFDQEQDKEVIHVTASEYFRQPLSSTFHGRDVFAPIAASLSKGVPMNAFGPAIQDEVRLPSLAPVVSRKGKLKARVIHVDNFGNCVTNLDRAVFDKDQNNKMTVRIKKKRIQIIRQFYGEGKADDGLFAIWGSAGFLEISAHNRSAAKILKARRGDAVTVEFD